MQFYGQAEEDKALYALFKDTKGFYVDVGAYTGIRFSNTYLFELQNWRGICIEPHEKFFLQLQKNRPNSVCLQVAVWDEPKDSINLYAAESGSWSMIYEDGSEPSELPDRFVEIQHPSCRTLDSILKEYNAPVEFEILSIDVEGREWHILNGFTLGEYLPRVVVIEFPHVEPKLNGYFSKYNYTVVGKEGSFNHMYCREKEDAEIIKSGWN